MLRSGRRGADRDLDASCHAVLLVVDGVAFQIDVSEIDISVGQNRDGSLVDKDQQLRIVLSLEGRQSFQQSIQFFFLPRAGKCGVDMSR